MNDTIKGAIIGAVIPTVGSFIIFFLGNFQTQSRIEKNFVKILSESFDFIDNDMTFKQSVKNINEEIQILKDENNDLKYKYEIKEEQYNNNFVQKKEKTKISIFHFKELLNENVGLYSDSYLPDNLGNVYSEGMCFYRSGFVEYTNLDDYTNLTGTLVVSKAGNEHNFEGIFSIYNLDTMEKIYDDIIIKRGMEPYPIDCDISDVKKIRITFNLTQVYDKYVVYFVDPKFEQ